LSDLYLASVALREQDLIYSIDPHFDLIPGIQRFNPDE
jgi:hypothetical protein